MRRRRNLTQRQRSIERNGESHTTTEHFPLTHQKSSAVRPESTVSLVLRHFVKVLPSGDQMVMTMKVPAVSVVTFTRFGKGDAAHFLGEVKVMRRGFPCNTPVVCAQRITDEDFPSGVQTRTTISLATAK